MTIALLPGDARQELIGKLLSGAGYTVVPYEPGLAADAWLFPLPTGGHPALKELPEGALALVGKAAGLYPGLRLRDYFAPESVQLKNAAITAEAAIVLTVERQGRCLFGARVLITGFGRIGRALAPRLRALGAEVTVYARGAEQRALAETMGCCALSELPPEIRGFDILYNTIPAPVITGRPEGLCLELASPPGGFLIQEAAVPMRGLPGQVAPRSAAEVLYASITDILQEEETS